MGGAQAGEVASKLAAAALEGDRSRTARPAPEKVTALIQEANRRVYERAHADPVDVGHGDDDDRRARRGRAR